MDAILVPWLARADALCPEWRALVHGGHLAMDKLEATRRTGLPLRISKANVSETARFFSTRDVLTAAQQLELREVLELLVLELLVLALQVDPSMCMELACEGREFMSPLDGELFERDERLRIVLDAALTPDSSGDEDLYKAFFVDWSVAAASRAFQESRAALVGLLGRERRGHRLELALELMLCSARREYATLELGPMVRLLASIDRDVFHVTQIDLTIKHSVYKADELVEFFRLVHGFRDHADVCIRLQMCHDMQRPVNLGNWKILFDLVSRKTFPIPSQSESDQQLKKKWDLLVLCGGLGLDNEPECGQDRWHMLTDARLVAACFSALAHAGDHVTSVRLVNPLEDKTSGYREPSDRSTRAECSGISCGMVSSRISFWTR